MQRPLQQPLHQQQEAKRRSQQLEAYSAQISECRGSVLCSAQVQHFSARPCLNPTKSGAVCKPRWWRAGSRWGCEREQCWMLNSLPCSIWMTLLDMFWSFPELQTKSKKRREGMRMKGLRMKGGNKGGISPMRLCKGLVTRGRRISCKVGPWDRKSDFFWSILWHFIRHDNIVFHNFSSQFICVLSLLSKFLFGHCITPKQTPLVCPRDSGDLHSTTTTSSPTPSCLCREHFLAIYQPFSWSPSALTRGSVSLHPLRDNDLITTARARHDKLYSDT